MKQGIRQRTKWKESPFPELYEDEPKTPFCEALAKGKHKSELILIHHLHEVALPFINSLSRWYKIRKIVGIPYSSVDCVVEELGKSFDVVVPKRLEDIPSIAKQSVSSSSNNVIIEEIGGYTNCIAQFLDESKHVLGVVEDTHQGYWLWQNNGHRLNRLPVLSVACSSTKRFEDNFIAKSIIDGLARYLHETKLSPIKKQRILVLGFGNIGEQLCKYLDSSCLDLSVYDIDPIRLLKAGADYKISCDLSDADIIIGVTGKQSIKISDIKKLRPGTLLVSGSSKRVEFDQSLPGIVNDGEPINLRYSVVPSSVLDLVYGSLVYCINKIDGGFSAKGLHDLSYSEQQDILRDYKKIYKKGELLWIPKK